MNSRALQELCCLTQATLFNVCISEDDLRELRFWHEQPSRKGFSPAVWCRGYLHKACTRDSLVAQRVTDLLDLRYLDTVLLVRSLTPSELNRTVELWLAKPEGAALPGLLWALCTEPRQEGHALGSRLCHEAVVIACRALVGGTSEASLPQGSPRASS